jgi:chemotaxis signal transduction protein
MIGYEEKAKIVVILKAAADAVGNAVNCVEEMARRDIETVRAVPEQADGIVVQGPDLIRALRTLIGRYER